MNPYEQKRRWKFLLLAFAFVIASASLWYTNYLVKNIAVSERTRAEVWAMSFKKIIEIEDINDEYLTVIFSIRDSLSMPTIVTNEQDSIIYWRSLDSTKTNFQVEESGNESAIFTRKIHDPRYFKTQLAEMKSQHIPIVIIKEDGQKWFVYYKDSQLLSQLRVFPYIQLMVIAIFLMVAYTVFSSSRRSEQNLVWVGLAKETAHQLGTPISSLMAWIELLKSKFNADEDPLILEMENDVQRLEMVADRFSKIGSTPNLHSHPVFTVISTYVDYFKVRTSKKIKFKVSGDQEVEALMNIPLFEWVIENLMKNSVNAIEGDGTIEIQVIENLVKEQVFIDIIDSGKGIPRLKFETIFQPGYTTRKRGWGLGLSLTKRIVENYHRGQIYVKDSEPGIATTIRIVLKSSTEYEPADA
ncbi:Sensor protein of zinc sigma-54-dependent two-component system [Arcticibacter svalbardensis MN12-7]|uniref:histidine kinase n=1 Tax=Arcticibacter svalbardensis MN12-7 TaxID=1150600 RepID=R9GQD5_9SPHI|nr:HAMP domain-containing sensor histidine kinase [Arcticibacter svalbardensis]EOR93735.1 Sensor protein of zinc sigma-54-dependent two-component system [Arcticibacter svalbardensis MN12-7]